MSIVSAKMIPEGMRTNVIRVYSYRDKNPQGTLYNPFRNEEVVFGSLTQLLLAMEQQMDAQGYPQATTQSRRFKEKPQLAERSAVQQQLKLNADQDAIATFHLKVLFRQGSSWQGELLWVEGRQQVSFRSVLELIKLMDNTLPQETTCSPITDGEAAGIS